MRKFIKNNWIVVVVLFATVFVSSCLKDPYEDDKAAEQSKIDQGVRDNKFTDADKLENGIYLKFYNDTAANLNQQKPKEGETIIILFTGEYTDGTILETTDSELGAKEFPNRYIVYGPAHLKVGNLIYGFNETIKYFSPGDSGTMLIPSQYAWYDYNPIVYHAKLLEIIEDDSTYEADNFYAFFSEKKFKADCTLTNGVYWKRLDNQGGVIDTLNKPYGITTSQSAIIKLTARYIDGTDRIFFPLGNALDSTTFTRKFGGTISFPFVPAIDTAIAHMNKGDILEICGLSGIAYGRSGFYDPYYNQTIVPPNMPVHYRIELVDVK